MLGKIFRKKISEIIYSVFLYIPSLNHVNPNLITSLSLMLSFAAFYFVVNKLYLFSLVFIMASSLMDMMDGAVARKADKKTLFGDYFDALIDRYREIIFYTGFALSGFSLEAFFAMVGSLIISYAKARTALTIKIEDYDWPAIGEMLDRLILLIIGISIAAFRPIVWGFSVISLTLWSIALVTNIGAIQRIFYAKRMIEKSYV